MREGEATRRRRSEEEELAGEVEVEEEEDEDREEKETLLCQRGTPQTSIGDYGNSVSRWRSASIAEWGARRRNMRAGGFLRADSSTQGNEPRRRPP